MRELIQAEKFFCSLSEQQKADLCDALAEDIFFLEDSLQKELLRIFDSVHPELGSRIRERNCFTT